MPLQYQGTLAEHRAVRNHVGIFDVSHMGEIDFEGPAAFDVIQYLITNDAAKLSVGQSMYTVVCNPQGGIVDDCIVYRLAEQAFRIVVNAANISKDNAFFCQHADRRCAVINRSSDIALIAVQGPQARALVAALANDFILEIPRFAFAKGMLSRIPVIFSRTGYTGEDGFELFVDADKAVPIWEQLLTQGAAPIGLGARDTLRLEAGLRLYGNDMDEQTTPWEAGLGWVVKLDKRTRGVDFLGGDMLAHQKAAGLKQILVGFRVQNRGVIRKDAQVLDPQGQIIGRVTSGNISPALGESIGFAYVPPSLRPLGSSLILQQRGKTWSAEVVSVPFYKSFT